MAQAEIPQFTPTEAFREATEMRRRFDEALLNNPRFLQAAAEIILHPTPWSTRDIPGGHDYQVGWEEEGALFIVDLSYSVAEEILHVSIYYPQVGESILITTKPRNGNDEGSLVYSKAYIGGGVFDACQDDSRAVLNAEEILRKLTQA